MRFSCKRSLLAEAAVLVGQAVASKSTKRVFECLRLVAGSDGTIEISGTDLDVAARHRLREHVSVREGGEAVVPAAVFSGLLREIGDETVTVSHARQKMTIETDGGTFEIECEDPSQFPEIPPFPERGTGSVASADIRALIRKTSFAAGKEAARYVLNGVRMIVEGGSLRMVACDGRRLATLVRPIELVPGTEAKPISAIVGIRGLHHFERVAALVAGSVEVAIADRFVAIRTPHAEVSARVLDGSFPDYDQIIPKDCPGKAQVPVGMFLSRIRQAEKFASIESQAVIVTFRPGEMAISASGGDGRADVRLGIEYDGPEEKIGFNPVFVIDALKAVDGETVRIEIKNRNAAARICDESGFLCVIMPVLIDS